MSPRSAVASLLLASLASLALGFAVSSASEDEVQDPGELGIEWAYRPDDLGSLVERSPAVVVAEVQDVRSGSDVALGSGGSPVTVPTQLVDVEVTQVIDGEAPTSLSLYQLGGPGLHAEGDPGYTVGERYVLFVRPRLDDDGAALNPDGTWLPVAPDGRLERVDGELDAAIDGPIADELDGATVQDAVQAIEGVAGGEGS